jgi:hypothetical protein
MAVCVSQLATSLESARQTQENETAFTLINYVCTWWHRCDRPLGAADNADEPKTTLICHTSRARDIWASVLVASSLTRRPPPTNSQ